MKKIKFILSKLFDKRLAVCGYLHGAVRHGIYFVSSNFDWSIYWDGYYITSNIRDALGVDSHLVKNCCFLFKQVVHFGDGFEILNDNYKTLDESNRIAVTFFHGSREDQGFTYLIDTIIEQQKRIDYIITVNSIMSSRLKKYGLNPEKIMQIPLGVDLDRFSLSQTPSRELMRERLGIKPGQIVIGSFQKDGVGWKEGLEPKLIKGPDIFLKVVEKLAKKFAIYVLLTGPARGYMKKGLERLDIPYKHIYVNYYPDIAQYYRCLDLYLVTSRDEGGPKAILEAMATGVPVVSTRVGMAADLIENGANGFVDETEDVVSLTNSCEEVIKGFSLRQRFIENGLKTVRRYDWKDIAMQYYEKVYKPLLSKIGR